MSTDRQGPRPMPRQDLSAFSTPRGVAASRLAPRRRPAASTPVDEDLAVDVASADDQEPIVDETPAQPTEIEPGPPVPVTASPSASPPQSAARARTSRPSISERGTRQRPGAVAEPRPAGQIIVYLKDHVADRLRATSQRSGRTHLQLIVDAIDATHEELPELLEAAGYIDRPRSSLFGDSMKGVRRRASGERKAQIGVRPPASVLGVIDQLVVDSAAPHRSALVEVALDKHLPTG